MPKRPDFEEVIKKVGYAEGHSQLAGTNVWPIDILKNGDVYVGDGYGKIENGTLLGDRLANSIYAKSNNGIILWGSVRNIQEIRHVEGFNGWILADHPSAISEMMLTSINAPIRIGQTTVLPGDVAYATPFGTLFIPAYLASQVVLNAEISNLRHVYGIMRLKQGDWTTGMIDSRWTDQMTNEFHAWMQKQPDSELPMPRQELNDYIKSQKK
jgi:regulator of RNase E activity RraA